MNSSWEDNVLIWRYNDNILTIKSDWIYNKLINDFDFEVSIYSNTDRYVSLNGYYIKNKTMEIKKFFFDNYPFIEKVTPMKYGIDIFFKCRIKYI